MFPVARDQHLVDQEAQPQRGASLGVRVQPGPAPWDEELLSAPGQG